MSINEQIALYFRSKGIKQGEVAQSCGWKQSFVSGLLNGRRVIGEETALKLNKVYGFDIHWLMTGEGEMLRKNEKVEVNGNNNQETNHSNNVSIDTNEEILTMLKSYCESLKKKDEQIDRLLTLLEKANKD